MNSREQILYGFALEPEHNPEILTRYIETHPELRTDLIELAWELNASKFDVDETQAEIPDSSLEKALGELLACQPSSRASNPFSQFAGGQFAKLCNGLKLPRGFMMGIRDRRVRLDSIPERFLVAASGMMDVSVEELREYLNAPPMILKRAAFKADGKPTVVDQVSFEQLITDTEMSDDQRRIALGYLDNA